MSELQQKFNLGIGGDVFWKISAKSTNFEVSVSKFCKRSRSRRYDRDCITAI